MPRQLVRQEPPQEPLGGGPEPWCDALLVAGEDRAAAHRAHIRALNTARQAAERLRRSGGLQSAEDDGAHA